MGDLKSIMLTFGSPALRSAFTIYFIRQEALRHSQITKLCFAFASALSFHYLYLRKDTLLRWKK